MNPFLYIADGLCMTLSVVYLLIWRNGASFAFSIDACPWQDFGREEYDFSLRPAQSFKTRKNLSYLISSVWGSIYYFGNLSPLYFSHMFFKRQRFCPHLPVRQHIFFPRLCFTYQFSCTWQAFVYCSVL